MRSKSYSKKQRCSLHINRRSLLFPILDLTALVFAQALKAPISFMTFLFALLFPIFPIVWLAAASAALRTSVRVSSDTIEKNTPFSVVSLISNNSPFPFPFVEAELLLPDQLGAKCISNKLTLSLTPLDSCELRKSAQFSFRGEYSVGLSKITVSDPLGFARLSIPCESTAKLLVLPRRLELPDKALLSESDTTSQTRMISNGSDLTEAADIRAYAPGDHMKSIHWKLSSKAEELIVRDYSQNIGDSVCILCDLETHYANGSCEYEPLDDYAEVYDALCADLAVEYALAAALRELKKQNTVKLLWLSQNGDMLIPNSALISDNISFEAAYRAIARSQTLNKSHQLSQLASLLSDHCSSIIISTASLNAAAADECMRLSSELSSGGARRLELIYSPPTKFQKQSSIARKNEQRLLFELSSFIKITQITI